MPVTIDFLRSKRNFLLISVLWVLLWVVPWGALPIPREDLYLAFLVDMIRLGVALTVFIVPGILLYLLLRPCDDPGDSWLAIVPIGFSLSVFVIALVGLIGRMAGFPFDLVRNIFFLIGLAELLLLMIFRPDPVLAKDRLGKSFRAVLQNPPLLFALIIATLMTFHDYLFFIDDTSYLAYLTNWQHSSRLGFMNIVHEGNVIENVRFWLALYPMGQALLADLSGVPGILLLGNYLELFLVPMAVFTSYWFARYLGLSPRASGFAVLIQVSLYTWMLGEEFPVGMWFYENLAEDKVSAAFILAPVFFVFVLNFLRLPGKQNLLLVLVCGLGLTFTHPITLFYACVIAGGLALFSWLTHTTRLRLILQLMAVFAIILVPYVLIRFSDIPSRTNMPFDGDQASKTFQPDRYVNVVSDVFYGLNPQVLQFMDLLPAPDGYNAFQFFRLTPIILAAAAGIVALVYYKKGPLYWYVLSCVLLVFFVTVPYTGWIIGQFVSARVVPRAAWFSPLGLSGVLILLLFSRWLRKRRLLDESGKRLVLGKLQFDLQLLGISLCLIFIGPVLAYNLFVHGPGYFTNLDEYQQLAQVGAYIDKNTSGPVITIALDYTSTQLLPGVSAHTVLISFREETARNGFNGSFSLEEIRARTYASNAIRSLDPGSSATERCFFIQKYNVKYVLAYPDTAGPYTDLIGKCGITASPVFTTKDMVLLELQYSAPATTLDLYVLTDRKSRLR